MSKTDEAIAAIPAVREEAVNQAGVAKEESPFSVARDLVVRVVVETASCIACEFIKGSGKHDPGSHMKRHERRAVQVPVFRGSSLSVRKRRIFLEIFF
jgi:hypothetical protein